MDQALELSQFESLVLFLLKLLMVMIAYLSLTADK